MKDITKKLYINEGRDYLEVVRRRDKVEVQGREIPLSEHDRPYLMNDEDDDTYQSYEEDFVLGPLPDWPQLPPDAAPGPCSAEDGCGHVTIMRDYPATIECGDFFWFRTTHEVHGCNPPGGAAAILAWGASAGTITSSAVGAKWIAPDCCHDDEVVISVSGPGGECEDKAILTIQCECCVDFEIDGPETTNPANTYTASIVPPCPGAKAYISSNSNCNSHYEGEVTPAGDEVNVTVSATAGGAFTITIVDKNSGCEVQAVKSVRVNDQGPPQPTGYWNEIEYWRSPPVTEWCPGDWFDDWYPLAAGVCSGGSWLTTCGPCTDGRYRYANIGGVCCIGWDWASGTEWEKDTYFYSEDPCGFDYDPPCGCSKTALCPVGYIWEFQARLSTGEMAVYYRVYDWIAPCT